MQNKKAAVRYAKALYGLVKEQEKDKEALKDFETIDKIIKENRDFENFVESPLITNLKKKEIFNQILSDRISKLTMDFIELLAKKGRESLIPQISKEFLDIYNKDHNRLPVEITSAVELSKDSQNEIVKKISDWTNKTVLADFIINENIKGGLKIKINDWVFDSSLENQLDKLHKALAG